MTENSNLYHLNGKVKKNNDLIGIFKNQDNLLNIKTKRDSKM